jgi:hypothetical protein
MSTASIPGKEGQRMCIILEDFDLAEDAADAAKRNRLASDLPED